jgi:hypothetical protein
MQVFYWIFGDLGLVLLRKLPGWLQDRCRDDLFEYHQTVIFAILAFCYHPLHIGSLGMML